MKKHIVLTAVASLLTFTSVAVLPAFTLDTGACGTGTTSPLAINWLQVLLTDLTH